MGDSRRLPRFGALDLDLGDEGETPARGVPTVPATPRRKPSSGPIPSGIEGTPASGVSAREGGARTDESLSLDLDPFGGLVLIDERLAATAPPPGLGAPTVIPRAPVPCAAPNLSLTQRHSIPTLLTSAGEISKLPIDHRAGFLLAHVDGMHTLEEILDVCAMPATEALELMDRLREMGVIDFE